MRQAAYFLSLKSKTRRPNHSFISNAVVKEVMRKAKVKWATKKYGRHLGYGPKSILTNFRFAGDILLVARSLPQSKQMIADLCDEGNKAGLELHPNKTKTQRNNIGCGSGVRMAEVRNMNIEVLQPTSNKMYLGRALTLTSVHDSELDYRLQRAWAKFGAFKQELTDKATPLPLRLKLFHFPCLE